MFAAGLLTLSPGKRLWGVEMDKGNIDVSKIIPLYRGKKYCRQLLGLITRNYLFQEFNRKITLEVIFVNDYPKEEIALETENILFPVRILNHKENKGIHAARVTGVRNAEGKYIVLFDQDDFARDNWIYSQWHRIEEARTPACVCNGWMERFRTLGDTKTLEENISSTERLICSGNPIMSPGQVIMRKDCIPEEWFQYIQQVNGADDFLLWVMMLKKGHCFVVNDEYLYYHTSVRTPDSIVEDQMICSLKEVLSILSDTGILNKNECGMLDRWIKLMEAAGTYCYWKDRDTMRTIRQMRKNSKIFHVMRNWIDLKNQGKDFKGFFVSHQYRTAAIYGMGYIGESLYLELKNSNIQVMYAVDRSAIDFKQELAIFRMEEELPETDIIIVTLVEKCDDICRRLAEKVRCPVVTIQQLLAYVGTEEHL